MNPASITIVQVGLTDAAVLHQLARETFIAAFAAYNTVENMNAYLAAALSEVRVQKELQHPGSRFYFALDEDRPIGYLKVNFGTAQTDLQSPDSLEIERIYLLPACYGQGIGKLLYEQALELAKRHQLKAIWLGVWEHNKRAIRFYERLGFEAFGTHDFYLGSDLQQDVLMRKIIV